VDSATSPFNLTPAASSSSSATSSKSSSESEDDDHDREEELESGHVDEEPSSRHASLPRQKTSDKDDNLKEIRSDVERLQNQLEERAREQQEQREVGCRLLVL